MTEAASPEVDSGVVMEALAVATVAAMAMVADSVSQASVSKPQLQTVT
jgi:hypothetical protein